MCLHSGLIAHDSATMERGIAHAQPKGSRSHHLRSTSIFGPLGKLRDGAQRPPKPKIEIYRQTINIMVI
jgi:hypothetical protein